MALGWRDGSAGASAVDRTSASRSGRSPPRRSAPARPRRVLEGRSPTPETADLAAETLAGELAPDRRRPLDRRVPPAGRRAGPPSAHPRGGRLVMTADRPSLAIDDLDVIAPGAFAAAVAPLFEGAPRFLGRLAVARPFGTVEAMFARARAIAHDDAARRADRADRRPSAPRRAAGHGLRAVATSSRATTPDADRTGGGTRPRRARGPASPPSSTGSTPPTRRASGSATASSSPAGRGPPCCPGWRPRSTPTATPSSTARSTPSSTSRRPAMRR